jgi:hypothetical protein
MLKPLGFFKLVLLLFLLNLAASLLASSEKSAPPSTI